MMKDIKMAAVTLLFSVLASAMASCVGEHTDYPNEEGLVLTADKTSISVEDTDGVRFTVTNNGMDVTDQCLFADVTEETPLYLDGSVFVSKRPGSYNFQAFYGDNLIPTNEVSIRVRNTSGGTTDFYRRILVADYTGTWCSYCFQMVNSINAVAKNYPDRLMVLSIHVDDEFSLGNEASLEASFGVAGLPTSVVDWRDVVTNAGGSYAISKAVEKSLAEPTVCGIGIQTKLEGSTLTVETSTCFLEKNQYRIGVVLVEDGIVGTQASVNGSYTHNSVIRGYCTKALGDDVKSNTLQGTEIAAGETVTSNYTFENFSQAWKKENCRIIVYVLKKQTDGVVYHVNNVQDCRLDSSIGFEYESE